MDFLLKTLLKSEQCMDVTSYKLLVSFNNKLREKVSLVSSKCYN